MDSDTNGDQIWFEQSILNGTNFVLDIEDGGYSQIKEIEDYVIYYRDTDPKHVYIWNDGKYYMQLISNQKISNEELLMMLHGMTNK